MKNLGSLLLVSVFSGAITLGAYKLFMEDSVKGPITVTAPNYAKNVNYKGAENIDFIKAAEQTVHSVVHVKNTTTQRVYNDPFSFYFGGGRSQEQYQIGTGSGVIISQDGFIVTNNHVIQNASDLEVTLNDNRTFKAKLIGTDSKMDIALLKIDSDEKLPFTIFGDSDNLQVGEWVLAVGNPYNLTSTVTAGIVSAKARDLSNRGIQSFIQTDAAVNPGNSGGALVNTRGELIGINTMISSQTGSYVGYSFAVPSNITKKIIEDLMQFGNVQRGSLGISGRELTGAISKDLGINQTQGIYIDGISKNSGAEKAGIKKGDIITKLDNKNINSMSDLTATIQTKRPNESINVGLIRDGKLKTVPVKLTKTENITYEFNEIEFENISDNDRENYNLDYGIKIKTVNNEKYLEYKNILEGSIVLSIDRMKATDIETISEYLKNKKTSKALYKLITKDGEVTQIYIN